MHGAVFVDAGHAWVERFSRSDVTVSFGAELSLDAVVGLRPAADVHRRRRLGLARPRLRRVREDRARVLVGVWGQAVNRERRGLRDRGQAVNREFRARVDVRAKFTIHGLTPLS